VRSSKALSHLTETVSNSRQTVQLTGLFPRSPLPYRSDQSVMFENLADTCSDMDGTILVTDTT
jgi:hypothetical protein